MQPGPGPSPLHLGLSLSHTWLRGAAWRRPDSRVEELLDVSVELDLARAAEQAGIDFLLKPDAAWLDPSALDEGPGFTMLDPTVLLSAIATHTSRIGLVTTLVERARAGAIDGVIALPGGALDSARRFLEEVVPALQRTGLVREAYAGETLADHLAIRR